MNNQAKEVQKATGNNLPLEIGNRVKHTVSGTFGIVFEIAMINGNQVISIETREGRKLRGLSRAEFVLESGISLLAVVAEPKSTKIEVLEGVKGASYASATDAPVVVPETQPEVIEVEMVVYGGTDPGLELC